MWDTVKCIGVHIMEILEEEGREPEWIFLQRSHTGGQET